MKFERQWGAPIEERLLSRRLIDENDCWLWQGAIAATTGYGKIHAEGKLRSVHRVAYETIRGPIPEGMQLDHLCRVRACFNPAHLEVVTSKENNNRGNGNGSKTTCPKGHPYDEVLPNGRRSCRECRLERMKQWRGKRQRCG